MGIRSTKSFEVSIKSKTNLLSKQDRAHEQILVDMKPPDTSRNCTRKAPVKETVVKIPENPIVKVDINQARKIQRKRSTIRPASLYSQHAIIRTIHKSNTSKHESGLSEDKLGIFQSQTRNSLVQRKRFKLIRHKQIVFTSTDQTDEKDKEKSKNFKSINSLANSLVNRLGGKKEFAVRRPNANVKKFYIARDNNISYVNKP